MTLIHIPEGWEIPEHRVTDESVYLNRREFVRRMSVSALALGAGGLAGGLAGCSTMQRGRDRASRPADPADRPATPENYGPVDYGIEKVHTDFRKAPTNPDFSRVPDGRKLVDLETAASYNNFYEFSKNKKAVWKKVGDFHTRPWTVEVSGLVARPQTFDVDALMRKMEQEERIYRFRCVEAWSMVVPWTGFPMRRLVEAVQPLSKAKYVRMISYANPKQMPGVRYDTWYPWPYFEALRIDEAVHPLTMVVTGIYGRPLPRQNGAPLRLIVPWKYGYKSIKSIVKIEFVASKPDTFWHSIAPDEYGFVSNVDPHVPHPRWSQATERDIQTGDEIRTQMYNGYGDQVANLYQEMRRHAVSLIARHLAVKLVARRLAVKLVARRLAV